MARAYSPSQILKMKKKVFAFEGEWLDAFGTPEQEGIWFIWGNSGNGKTSFVMQLCRELAKFGKVAYNSMEEGTSDTVKQNIIRFDMDDLDGRMLIIDCEPTDKLTERLAKRRSPDFVIIDSFQHAQLSYKEYLEFKAANKGKLIIFVSHASGRLPAGRPAVSAMYDATLKIYVEGYRAHSKGRYIGDVGYFDIWKEKAINYWGERTLDKF